jgi:hypothetical protein
MSILYIVVVPFVIALLLSIPLYPFWKVWKRLQTHHQDIWMAAGPFDVFSMVRSPALAGIFTDVLVRIENDKDRHAKDPDLAKWTHVCIELIRMAPRTFIAQITCFLVFFYFTGVFSKLLMSPFNH